MLKVHQGFSVGQKMLSDDKISLWLSLRMEQFCRLALRESPWGLQGSIMNSGEILRKLRASQQEANEAFGIVYDTYAERIYTYCRRILNNDTRVLDDIFQNVFVMFYEAVRKGTEIENINSYLLRTARNLCWNEQKRAGFSNTELMEELHGITDQSYEQKQLMELIHRAVELLPNDLRDVFVMREELGMEYDEIAEAMNITMGSARNRIWKAKQQVREILSPYLHDLNNRDELS